MRKFFLSGFVILAFLVFSLHLRFEKPDVPVVPSANLISGQTNLLSPVSSSASPSPNITQQIPLQVLPPPVSRGRYKDGTFSGDVTDAYYGNVQVQVVVSAGKITDVVFLDYPHDRSTSREINSQAMPYLKSEAITAQSANIDGVSGASQTSAAFVQSLQAALTKAS